MEAIDIIKSILSLLGISSIIGIFYFLVNFFADKFNFTPNKFDKFIIILFSINISIALILIYLFVYNIEYIFELSLQIKNTILFISILIFSLTISNFFLGNSKKFALLIFMFINIVNSIIFLSLQQKELNKYYKNEYHKYINQKIKTLMDTDKYKAIDLTLNYIDILKNQQELNENEKKIYEELSLNLAHEFTQLNNEKEAIEYYQKALNSKVKEISQSIEKELNKKYYSIQNGHLKHNIYLANLEGIDLFKSRKYNQAMIKYKEALESFMSENKISKDILNKKYNFDSFKPIVANLKDKESFIKLNFNIAHTYFELQDFNNSYKHFDLALLGAYATSNTEFITSICQGILSNKEYIKDINFTIEDGKKILKYIYQEENEKPQKEKDFKLIKEEKEEYNNFKTKSTLEFLQLDIGKANRYLERGELENALMFYSKALIVALDTNIHYVIYIHNKIALIQKNLNNFKEAISEYKLVEFYLQNLKNYNLYSPNERKFLEDKIVKEKEEENIILQIESNLERFDKAKNNLEEISLLINKAYFFPSKGIIIINLIKIKNQFFYFHDAVLNFRKIKVKATILQSFLKNGIQPLNSYIIIKPNINDLQKINNMLLSSLKAIKFLKNGIEKNGVSFIDSLKKEIIVNSAKIVNDKIEIKIEDEKNLFFK